MLLPPPLERYRLSRDRNFLLRAALVITAVSVILAFFVSWIPTNQRLARYESSLEEMRPGDVSSLIALVRLQDSGSKDGTCTGWMEYVPEHFYGEEIEAVMEDLRQDPSVALIKVWWKGLHLNDPATAIAELEKFPPTMRYRNEFLGDLSFHSSDSVQAMRYYLAEAALFAEADYARRCAVFLARYDEDRVHLKALLEDPSFREAFPSHALSPYEAYARDYLGLARSVLATQWEIRFSPYLFSAIFTCAIWFGILLAFREKSRKSLLLSFVGLALGMASATLTLYVAMIQEGANEYAFQPNDTVFAQFLYFLTGIALREETLKLLCFLPLAIVLRKKGTALEALLLAGMVGLGFAFRENILYFRVTSDSFNPWMRLLTANALHFSLTGVAGYYLWRMLSRRFRGWEEFLVSFLAVVFAHALYNALLAMPILAEYSSLSPILAAVIAYQYFDPLRQHMDSFGAHRRYSPLGIFILGSVLLACGILIAVSASMPFRFALGYFAMSLGSLLPLCFAFISRFRDL